MGIEVTNLQDIDPVLVEQEQARSAQLLNEAFPQVDLKRGVIHDTVLHLEAVISGMIRTEINRFLKSGSLKAIQDDPTLASDDIVDAVLSNFRITREAATLSAGQVTFVLDAPYPTTVTGGSRFIANGVEFMATESFSARLDQSAIVSSTDRLLRPMGNGRYAFTIPVSAVNAGAAGAIRRGTVLAPTSRLPHVLSVYAETDFTGGADAESNSELIGKLQLGLAAKTWSNRVTIEAMIKDQPLFRRILQISIVGAGDPEAHRDQHTIFPISIPGRVDLYARTDLLPGQTSLVKPCAFVRYDPDLGGIWQFNLVRDDAPGFYAVEYITRVGAATGSASLDVVTEIRDFEYRDDPWVPEIETAYEAAYSRYQVAAIHFADPATPPGVQPGDQADYTIVTSGMPLISELQTFLNLRGVRDPGGDVLVRAPIPCFLSLNFTIVVPSGGIAPNTTVIANALAQYVNTLGFPGAIYASGLSQVIQKELSEGAYIGAVDMWGQIRRPNGMLTYLRSPEVLTIPHDPDHQISGRTVAFFLDPQNIGIDVVTSEAPLV